MHGFRRLALGVLLVVSSGTALAQGYPAKPIRVIVPYPVGGAVDVMTRLVTNHMAQTLGQPMVIDNRPGANANIGPEAAARSAPDGYTLLASATFLVVNPLLESGLRWSPRDFTPVARFTQAPNVLVVPASSSSRTVAEFVAAARGKPGLPAGDAGPGAPQTLAIDLLRHAANIELQSVGYKGSPPILADLISGQLAVSVLPLNVVASSVQGGRIRALASTSNRRSQLLPDLPTMAESGYPDVTVISWYGFHAPAGTAPDVIRRLSDAVAAAAADEATRTRTAGTGGEISYMDTETFRRFLDEDAARWSKAVQTIRQR
jgi:tripartite-type tricarboxylate transporter receptor subunit TctC